MIWLLYVDVNQVNANLLQTQLGVDSKYIRVLPMNTPVVIDNPLGIPHSF